MMASESLEPMGLLTSDLAEGQEGRATLSKAVARSAERLSISQPLLAQILGVSPATVTRLYAGDYHLEPSREEWECARLFVRLFLSLASIVGDESTARQWLLSENLALNARPIDIIGHAEGLERVVCYLEDSRGPI